jgi:hypothetical protein
VATGYSHTCVVTGAGTSPLGCMPQPMPVHHV